MLKTIGFCVKFIVFSILVLVLGNRLHWNGKTISDQVKIGMSHAEESNVWDSVHKFTKQLSQDAREGFVKRPQNAASDDISPTERQKLRALIRELNTTHKKD
jgi:hypothetical protein